MESPQGGVAALPLVVGDWPTVCLDCGTVMLKAGLAGEAQPTVCFDTVVGRPRHPALSPEGAYIGLAAQSRPDLWLRRPLANGYIQDWEDLEKIWEHVLYAELRVEPGQAGVVLAEKPQRSQEERSRKAQVLFETHCVPRCFLANDLVLGCYAAGRTTGLAVELGGGVTQCEAVWDGYSLAHTYESSDSEPVGAMEEHLWKIVGSQRRGFDYGCSGANRQLMRRIKEEWCFVALDFEAEFAQMSEDQRTNTEHPSAKKLVLPDQTEILLGQELIQCAEILFNKHSVGWYHMHSDKWYHPSVDELARKSLLALRSTDSDILHQVCQNVLLLGGGSGFPNVAERLQSEIAAPSGYPRLPNSITPEMLRVSSLLQPAPSWRDHLYTCLMARESHESPARGLDGHLWRQVAEHVPTKHSYHLPSINKWCDTRCNTVQPAAWTGGSLLAGLSALDNMWMPLTAYDEIGPTRIICMCNL